MRIVHRYWFPNFGAFAAVVAALVCGVWLALHASRVTALSPLELAALSPLETVHAYLATDGLPGFAALVSGLLAWDVSDPRGMSEAGRATRIKPPEDTYDDHGYRDIAATDSWAILASGSDGVEFIDVSVPTSPTSVARLDLDPESEFAFGLYAERVSIDGEHAYVGWSCCNPAFPDMVPSGGVDVFELRPKPRAVARWVPEEGSWGGVRGLDVDAGRMYVLFAACGGIAGLCSSSMSVVDISRPASPHSMGSVDLGSFSFDGMGPNDLVFDDPHAFIADGDVNLVAVFDPTRPFESTGFSTPGDAEAIDFSGGYVYVADRMGGLFSQYVHGDTKPGAPDDLRTVEGGLAIDAIDVATTDTHAYVITSDARIVVYDITSHEPSLLSEIEVLADPDLRAIDVVSDDGGDDLSCLTSEHSFRTLPESPRAGEAFTLQVTGTSGWSCAPGPDNTSITIEGNTIVLTIRSPLCDLICLPVVTAFTLDLEFEGLSEGDYIIEWREGCSSRPPLCNTGFIEIGADSAPTTGTPAPHTPTPDPGTGPTPRPKAVFVHGYGGGFLGQGDSDYKCSDGLQRYPEDDTDFGWLAETFKDADYDTYLARWTSNANETIGIPAAADCLQTQLDGLLVGSPGASVTLVGHSLGGIVSRYFVERTGYKGDVDRLITYGSPHAGIPDAFLATVFAVDLTKPFFACDAHPGACQASVTSMTGYNSSRSLRSGVDYELVGGTRGHLLTSWGLSGEDDAVVQTESAIALSGVDVRRWAVHDTHALPFSPFARDHYKESAESVNCLLKILSGAGSPSGGCAPGVITRINDAPSGSAVRGLADSHDEAIPQHAPAIRGTLAAGESAAFEVDIDGGHASIGAAWRGGDMAIALVRPDGVRIDPETVEAVVPDGQYQHSPGEDGGLAAYDLPRPMPGKWSVELRAIGFAADFALITIMQSNVELRVAGPPAVAAGGITTVRAWLDDSGASIAEAEIWAEFATATETGPIVALRPDWTGGTQYVAEVPAPLGAVSGVTLRLRASGVTNAGTQFRREHTSIVPVIAPGVRLDGDAALLIGSRDTQGRIESLRLYAQVDTDARRPAHATVVMIGRDGRVATELQREIELPDGPLPLSFDIPGRPIGESGIDGPYEVELRIVDETGFAVLLHERPLVTTPGWLASDFVGGPPTRPGTRLYMPTTFNEVAGGL